MATDENSTITNKNLDETNESKSNFDDFDFGLEDQDEQGNNSNSANDDLGNHVNGLSSSLQNQIAKQGRSGMFLTPDEESQRKNMSNSNMDLDNMDISATMQQQKRSGMFMTPDEAEKRSAGLDKHVQVEENQGKSVDTNENETSGDPQEIDLSEVNPDVYFDGGGVEESVDTIEEDQSQSEKPENITLDPELSDFLSFDKLDLEGQGDDSPESENTDNQSQQDSSQPMSGDSTILNQVSDEKTGETSPENIIENGNTDEIDTENMQQKFVEQTTNDSTDSISGGILDSAGDNLGGELHENLDNINEMDDTSTHSESDDDWLAKEDEKVEKDLGINPDLDGNDLPFHGIDTPVSDNISTVEELISESTDTSMGDLHVENLGVNVVENSKGELVSDTGSSSGTGGYVPNEDDFSKMSDLLNSSETGKIELSTENIDVKDTKDDENLDSESQVEMEDNIKDDNLNDNTGFDSNNVLNLDNISDIAQNPGNIDSNISSEVDSQQKDEDSQCGINIDQLVADVTISQTNSDDTNQSVSNQLQNDNNESTPVLDNSNGEPQKFGLNHISDKTKKMIYGVIIAIFALVAITFLGCKMFPDVFSLNNLKNNLNSDNPVVDNNIEDDITDYPDPNSIAGILENNGTEDETGENIGFGKNENVELGIDENIGLENTDIGFNEQNGNTNTDGENIDVYGNLGEILDDGKSEDRNILNNYLDQAQIYYNIGLDRDDSKIITYSEYIINTANSMLQELENGNVIDTSVYNKFDTILGKLSGL